MKVGWYGKQEFFTIQTSTVTNIEARKRSRTISYHNLQQLHSLLEAGQIWKCDVQEY